MSQSSLDMNTIHNSTQYQLRPEQISEFHERGWIVLKNIFTPSELEPSLKAFGRLLANAQKIKTTQDYNGSRFVLGMKNEQVIINRVVWAGGSEPDLLRISEDPRLLIPVSQLLESKEMDQLLCQAHFKLPGDGVSFDWHQDIQHRDKGPGTWKDLNQKGSYVQSILLLDDMTQENGPLEFIPNSSQWGRVYDSGYEYDTPLSLKQKPDDIDYTKAVTVTGTKGSVVLFGPYTIHGSRANQSKDSRRILINGYAYPGSNSRVYPGDGAGRRIRLKF